MASRSGSGRIAFAYDQLYPETVGGAQRYYAALTGELARRRPVTYLTVKRWDGRDTIEREGVEIRGVCSEGRRSDFHLGLGAHLARHGWSYDVVHCACFPPGAAVAAMAGLALQRTPLIVDWHEVLPRSSWQRIRGRTADLRWLLQTLAVRGSNVAVTYSALHERRLREEGRERLIVRTPEFLPGDEPPAEPARAPRERLVVFLGRLVDDKRAHLVPPALAELRRVDPEWRGVLFGDGPERERVEAATRDAGVEGALELRGFAPWEEISETLTRGSALLLPTEREGFGLAVLEAAAHGLPSVLVAEPDNAA